MTLSTLTLKALIKLLAPIRTVRSNHLIKALTITSASLLLLMGSGAAPAPRNDPKTVAERDKGKPWIEAKYFCTFRLGEGRMPRDSRELGVALYEGWKQAITVPDPKKAIMIEGGAYPSVQTLRLDFSQGRIRPPSNDKKDKESFEVNHRVEKNLQVDHLEVVGTPVLMSKGSINMRLIAEAAKIDMQRDNTGRPVMVLNQARSGSMTFEVTRADAEAMMLQTARELASKYGVAIDSIKLLIVPKTPRDLDLSVHVQTRVALIPAGMHFHAHVLVDDAMNAHISGLSCDGDEALGPLIVHFLRPGLARYNDKTRPVMSFPADKIKLRDVAVKVDDSFHLQAAFGS